MNKNNKVKTIKQPELEHNNDRILKKLTDIPKTITIGYMNENNKIIIYDEFKKV